MYSKVHNPKTMINYEPFKLRRLMTDLIKNDSYLNRSCNKYSIWIEFNMKNRKNINFYLLIENFGKRG
jgi:hypothetical protein